MTAVCLVGQEGMRNSEEEGIVFDCPYDQIPCFIF